MSNQKFRKAIKLRSATTGVREKKGLEESFAKANYARDSILKKKWLIAMNELHKK